MRAFALLYAELDETTKTSEKVDALVRYFAAAPPADAAWALYFLSGRKIRQVISTSRLREWALEATGLPDWLFGESYDAVGDFAETVALLLPEPRVQGSRFRAQDERSQALNPEAWPLSAWVEDRLLPLRAADEATQRSELLRAWDELDSRERFIWNKLITGGLRVGVSQLLVTRALAKVSGVEQPAVAHRLMGTWEPTAAFYEQLLAADTRDADASQPYPFFLAYPIESDAEAELGAIDAWQAEWKWDGIRAQLIRRDGQTFLWSRGEELISERFPELTALGELLPNGTVIDGEVLPWIGEAVQPFAQLQKRIGRKLLTKKILDEVPVILLAYDLLEHGGRDLRSQPLEARRAQLEELIDPGSFITKDTKDTNKSGDQSNQSVASDSLSELRALRGNSFGALRLSPIVTAATWAELARQREESRDRNVEGLMLKRLGSPYRVGRVRGDWWKWKIAPYTIDAVLIYAQRGSGKRASLYTDYTFGVWDSGKLIPFAKAYSGLTDAEIRKVDAFVRRNTVETFGPVRTVTPELVFELAFEGIQRSTRHKSGIAVRFPRMLRWRTDKKPDDADSLETIQAMLPPDQPAS